MPSMQYNVLALALAAATLTAGCASQPLTPAEQAAIQQEQKAPCHVRTGSNYCRRDGGGSADVKAMTGEQMREAMDEMRIINLPRQ